MVEAPLGGKAAVVTGGSRGIGLAVASALSEEGTDVVICGRSAEALSEAKQQLEAQTLGPGARGRIESCVADVREPSDMDALMAHAHHAYGRLDILINNAGIGRFEKLATQAREEWRAVVDTNLTGVFYACHAAIPFLRQAGGGWIINVSSLAGSHPFAGGSAYCASKAGVNALSEVLMQEVRYDDIRVSSVAPGSVDTRFAGEDETAIPWKLDPGDVARIVIDLLRHDPRSLPSRVEIRPSRPRK